MSIIAFTVLLLASVAVGLILWAIPIRFVIAGIGAMSILAGHLFYQDFESIEAITGRMNQELLEKRYGLKKQVRQLLGARPTSDASQGSQIALDDVAGRAEGASLGDEGWVHAHLQARDTEDTFSGIQKYLCCHFTCIPIRWWLKICYFIGI